MTFKNDDTKAGPIARSSLQGAIAIAALASALAVAGCREAEQGRPIEYEPGTYLGQEDQPISAETLDVLRERARQGQQM